MNMHIHESGSGAETAGIYDRFSRFGRELAGFGNLFISDADIADPFLECAWRENSSVFDQHESTSFLFLSSVYRESVFLSRKGKKTVEKFRCIG